MKIRASTWKEIQMKKTPVLGRKNVEKFSYCPLHLMVVFQPKGKKEDVIDKDDKCQNL